jgi:hypothetical protein
MPKQQTASGVDPYFSLSSRVTPSEQRKRRADRMRRRYWADPGKARVYARKQYARNHEQLRAKSLAYWRSHREEILAKRRVRRHEAARNRPPRAMLSAEDRKTRKRAYYETNRGRTLAQNREYRNRPGIREKVRERRRKNRDTVLRQKRDSYRRNREKILTQQKGGGKHRYLPTSKEGVNLPSRVALQNPSDAQLQQTQPASLVSI